MGHTVKIADIRAILNFFFFSQKHIPTVIEADAWLHYFLQPSEIQSRSCYLLQWTGSGVTPGNGSWAENAPSLCF